MRRDGNPPGRTYTKNKTSKERRKIAWR